MTNEEKKEYLKSYRLVGAKLQALKEQQASILELISSARAIEYSDMPKGSGKQTDLSDHFVKLEELNENILAKTIRLNELRLAIERDVAAMHDGVECRLIRLRYLDGLTWEQIAVELDYSWKNTHRIHARALVNFKKDDIE